LRITTLRTFRITLVAFVAAGVLAASAQAKTSAAAPPLGRYNCYQFSPSVGYLFQGWFRLPSRSRYVLNNGRGGRYSYNAGNRRVTFHSGPYRSYGWVGEFLPRGRAGRRSPTIVLKERVRRDGITIYCYAQGR
jgi:hypothetical protein